MTFEQPIEKLERRCRWNRKFFLAALMVAALLAPQTVLGESFANKTGALLSNCEIFLKNRAVGVDSAEIAAKSLDCHSYIFGFVDGLKTGDGPRLACIPDGVNVLQLVQVFVKWAQFAPRHFWYQSRQLGVSTAFVATWPCRNKFSRGGTPRPWNNASKS
jgi:hypothetical protein